MERMDEGRLTKEVYRADVGMVRRRGTSRRKWRNGVGEFVERKGFTFEECETMNKEVSDLPLSVI